jgi:hypothetical protein
MPAPLDALAKLAGLQDAELTRQLDLGTGGKPIQFLLYDLLRHEQALAAAAQPFGRTEFERIIDLAQAAGELVGLLVGRSDGLLDGARDGEWSLRDVLRHAIAVELRYGAQIEYSAMRRDQEPLGIPTNRLPCDRLSPPEPQFGRTRTGDFGEIIGLLGAARLATDERLAGLADSLLERPSLWGTIEMNVRMRLHQVWYTSSSARSRARSALQPKHHRRRDGSCAVPAQYAERMSAGASPLRAPTSTQVIASWQGVDARLIHRAIGTGGRCLS